MGFFGLTDPYIWSAYVGCILCTVLCIVYGYLNKSDEEEESDE